MFVILKTEMATAVVQPKKSLGQHFLRDHNILRKIVDTLQLKPNDVVLEIGPGEGVLTQYLATHPVKLILVEVDDRVMSHLKKTFGQRATIIHRSFCDVDLGKLKPAANTKIRIVGNIPYYLTSEILFHIFQYHEVVVDATLMIQREVAQRLVAKPNTKEYGILSVAAQFYSQPELLFRVSRHVFFPKPKVESAVVRLGIKQTLPSIDPVLFSEIVRTTFGKRRKTLRNSLKYSGLADDILGILSIDLLRRPESLSVEEFVQLTQELSQIWKKTNATT